MHKSTDSVQRNQSCLFIVYPAILLDLPVSEFGGSATDCPGTSRAIPEGVAPGCAHDPLAVL